MANNIYGLLIVLNFHFGYDIGFIYELGKGALKINSRQGSTVTKFNHNYYISLVDESSKNQDK